MSRVPPREMNEYPWWVRKLLKSQIKKYGQTLEPAKIWARTPRVFLGLGMLFGALDRNTSPIDPELRALITVRVSQINWCTFCVDINSSLVLKRGGTEAKLSDLSNFRESPHFTEKEKAALDYAETMTITDRKVSEEQFTRLRQFFDEDALVELTGLIAFQNLSSKFNAALDIQPQGFCNIAPQPKGEYPM